MSRWPRGSPLRHITFSEEFIRLYRKMRARHRALERFALPEDVWACLEDRDSMSHRVKDAILKALILEYQRRPSAFLTEFLVARFLPGVIAICRRFHGWVAEGTAEVASEAWLCFHETLLAYDVERYPERVAGCLTGMTRNRLRSWLRRELREARCRASLRIIAGESGTRKSPEDGRKMPLASGDPQVFWERAEALLGARKVEGKCPDQQTMRRAERLLSELVDRGALRESDKYIIMASSVARRRLREVVSGDEYQKIKKRRQRALARLKLLLGEQAKRQGVSVVDVVREIVGKDE